MNSLQLVHHFTRVFVEEEIRDLPAVGEIIGKIRSAAGQPTVIPVAHYKDIFTRPRQDFTVQKRQPALILAKERSRYLHKGSERIDSWNNEQLHYNALVRNCVYNCDYCFLQGMHDSAHSVMFLNNADFIDAADKALEHHPLYLSISYLSEILAFEPLYPYCAEWIDYAAGKTDMALEIRTKSDYYQSIANLKPAENVFLVWSLSPEEVSRRHERGCASFRNRLFAAGRAARDGWPLKLTFDPIILSENWRELYKNAIRETFLRIPAEQVSEVSFGVFRMNQGYLERIRKIRTDAPHLMRTYHRESAGTLASYRPEEIGEIRRFMEDQLSRHLSDEQIFFVHG